MRDPDARRGLPASLAGLLVTGLLLGGVVLVAPGDQFETTRRLFGLGGERHGSPPAFTPGQGSHAFLRTQRGSDEPVAWDPCRPIEYVVNPDGAPEGWEELVDEAADDVAWATGMELVDGGTTEERPFGRFAGGLARPVVIGFADADELPDLAGDTAGLGGGAATDSALGRSYYVAGSIALDTDVFTDDAVSGQFDSLRAIVQHEMGHVLGLDHVDDPGELMFDTNFGRTSFGPGDLEGLARLAGVPCR